MSKSQIQARMVSYNEGHHMTHPTGANMSIKVFSSQTNHCYSLMETILPSGGVIPLHIHDAEDENNYILEGQLTMYIGEQIYHAAKGSYVVAPRGITQYFKNEGEVDCHFLTIFTPGGAENFFKEADELIKRVAPEKPNLIEMKHLQQKYGLNYL